MNAPTMLAVRAPHGHGTLHLSGLVASPYFQPTATRRVGGQTTGRDIRLIPVSMISMYIVKGYSEDVPTSYAVAVDFVDPNNISATDRELLDFSLSGVVDPTTLQAAAQAAINSYITSAGYTITNGIWPFLNAVVAPADSALSLSVQTSTGAVGTQVSATRNAWVAVNASVSTTANIAGNAAEDLVLEVAPTNSATAGDWVEKARMGNSQALTLAITLQSVQIVKNQLFAFVPAGYYVKVRSTGITGTTSASISSARQTLV